MVGAPKGTAPEVIAKLNGWLDEIGLSSEMKAALVSSGSAVGKGSPREVQDFVDADLRRWKDLAKKSNLDLD